MREFGVFVCAYALLDCSSSFREPGGGADRKQPGPASSKARIMPNAVDGKRVSERSFESKNAFPFWGLPADASDEVVLSTGTG